MGTEHVLDAGTTHRVRTEPDAVRAHERRGGRVFALDAMATGMMHASHRHVPFVWHLARRATGFAPNTGEKMMVRDLVRTYVRDAP